jgi:hypothetical protein
MKPIRQNHNRVAFCGASRPGPVTHPNWLSSTAMTAIKTFGECGGFTVESEPAGQKKNAYR